MAWIFPYLLFLHVMGSILAFGPTYAFGTYAGMAAQERGPLISFNNRARSAVVRKMVTPGTVVVLATGVLMIWARDIPWLDAHYRWLQLSFVLYVGMLAWNLLVSVPRQRQIAALGAQAAAAAAAGGPPPTGPSPEMSALIKQVRRDGKAMGYVVIIVVFLMVVKPAFP